MITDIIKYVDFLIEHNITASQDVTCRLLASEQEGYYDLPAKREAMTNFYRYFGQVIKSKVKDGDLNDYLVNINLMEDLVDKGFLKYMGNDDKPVFDDYYVTKKYLDIAFDPVPEYAEEFEEFWEEYPTFHETDDGKKLNIKAVNKEDMFTLYKKHLRNTSHEMMLNALKVAKAKNEVNTRFNKWLEGEFYNAYRDEVINGDIDNVGGIKQSVL